MSGSAPAATSVSLLWQAREVLSAVEREEREERQKLAVLEAQAELDPRRDEAARRKIQQWQVLRESRERLHAARRAYEELQRQAFELQHAIRREERTVAQWQRQIRESEEQLARWQRLLADARARLEQARQELSQLTGGGEPGR